VSVTGGTKKLIVFASIGLLVFFRWAISGTQLVGGSPFVSLISILTGLLSKGFNQFLGPYWIGNTFCPAIPPKYGLKVIELTEG